MHYSIAANTIVFTCVIRILRISLQKTAWLDLEFECQIVLEFVCYYKRSYCIQVLSFPPGSNVSSLVHSVWHYRRPHGVPFSFRVRMSDRTFICVLLQTTTWCPSLCPSSNVRPHFCSVCNNRRPTSRCHIVVYFSKFKCQIAFQILCMALQKTECSPVSFFNEYDILCTRIFFLFSQPFCSDRKIYFKLKITAVII